MECLMNVWEERLYCCEFGASRHKPADWLKVVGINFGLIEESERLSHSTQGKSKIEASDANFSQVILRCLYRQIDTW